MEFKRYWIGYTVVIAFAALYWVATPRPEQPHKVYVEVKSEKNSPTTSLPQIDRYWYQLALMVKPVPLKRRQHGALMHSPELEKYQVGLSTIVSMESDPEKKIKKT